MAKTLNQLYRRVEARTWLRKANAAWWGTEGLPVAIRRWRKKHPSQPSPYLLCLNCGAPTLDPAMKNYHAKKDGADDEIGDMLSYSPESFARKSCYECGGKKRYKAQDVPVVKGEP